MAATTTITTATADDLPALVDIHNHSVATSHSSFHTRPVTVDQQRSWLARFAPSGAHRMLVARRGRTVLGYASSSRYRDLAAFRETVEFGVSLHHEHRGQGVGSLLYTALLDALAGEPVHLAVAGIALPNAASIALHRKFGFTEVGTFDEYAIKHGRYISSLWMQRRFAPRA